MDTIPSLEHGTEERADQTAKEGERTDGEAGLQKTDLLGSQAWVDLKDLVPGVFIVGILPKPR